MAISRKKASAVLVNAEIKINGLRRTGLRMHLTSPAFVCRVFPAVDAFCIGKGRQRRIGFVVNRCVLRECCLTVSCYSERQTGNERKQLLFILSPFQSLPLRFD